MGQFNPETSRDLVTQQSRPPEVTAQLVRRSTCRRDRHQALQAQGRAADHRTRQRLGRVGLGAALPGRTAQVHLDEDRKSPAGCLRRGVEREREARRVDGVHPVEGAHRGRHLVALESSDQVPGGRPRDRRALLGRLLHVVLADVLEADVESDSYGRRGQCLGDGDEAHGGGIAPRATRGGADGLPDGGDARGRVVGRGQHGAHGPGGRRTSQVAGMPDPW